ncbi:uncharacterized protein LOC144487455, partial [Mustelus asterias]
VSIGPGVSNLQTSTIEPTLTSVQTSIESTPPEEDETDRGLAIGLGVGVPMFVLLVGFLAASIYIFQKKRKQIQPGRAAEVVSKDADSTTSYKNQNDHYAQSIIHHNQASAEDTTEHPVYYNTTDEAVYVNVPHSQTQHSRQEPKPRQTEADSGSYQTHAESTEPVYENLKRVP